VATGIATSAQNQRAVCIAGNILAASANEYGFATAAGSVFWLNALMSLKANLW
jgi:hypothetical protein